MAEPASRADAARSFLERLGIDTRGTRRRRRVSPEGEAVGRLLSRDNVDVEIGPAQLSAPLSPFQPADAADVEARQQAVTDERLADRAARDEAERAARQEALLAERRALAARAAPAFHRPHRQLLPAHLR